MGRIAREAAGRSGVNIESLLETLVSAAAAELTTYYHYAILGAHSLELGDQLLWEIINDIRAEDRVHFDTLVSRIYELDGALPADLHAFADHAGQVSPALPDTPGALVAQLAESEQRAIARYTALCAFTADRDHRTHDLALAIRREEFEHHAWLAEYLGTAPQPHFHRGYRGSAPFTTRAAP
jgi:ferritin-like protein